MEIADYDHVNLVMPAGEQDKARAFYGGVLGLEELEMPPTIAGRGTIWFSNGRVTVHVGVEDGFRPARRAHPAFRINGLEELRLTCEAAGHETIVDDNIPGWDRFFVYDPFGNRIECMQQQAG